jgi:hypothetical protein
MLDLMHFIFSSFWIWLGTVIMIGVVTTSFATVVCGFIAAARS